MNPTDHWNDLKSAGAVPPASPDVLAQAREQLAAAATTSHRPVKRRLIPVVAAAGVVAAVVVAIAVDQFTGDAVPGAGRQATPTVPATTPSTTPVPTPSTPSTGGPTQGSAASCVAGYSAGELKKRAFAFDGTVLKVVEDSGAAMPSYLLTFQVNEWFRPVRGARTVTVRAYSPPAGSNYQVSSEFPDYTVGSRLLITGEPRWGGTDPLKDANAFGCGFSRVYNAADAATWRQILRR